MDRTNMHQRPKVAEWQASSEIFSKEVPDISAMQAPLICGDIPLGIDWQFVLIPCNKSAVRFSAIKTIVPEQ